MTADVLDSFALLRATGASGQERLRPHARLRVLTDHETLFSEGQPADAFHFVVRGRVKLVAVAEHGRETILDLCGPGSAVCIPGPTAARSYCCSAVCMEPGTEVASLPREEVMKAVEDGNPLSTSLLAEVSRRCMTMCQRVSEMAAGQVEQRLARLLLDLAVRSSGTDDVAVGPTLRIPMRLTRQDVADLCGTSLETAIRIMSRWTKDHLIGRDSKGLVVLDPDALARVCRQPVRRARGNG